MVRHVGGEYPAPAEFQHGVLAVMGKSALGFRHHVVQCHGVADVVAMHRVDRDTELE
jgi:hypothetical protein